MKTAVTTVPVAVLWTSMCVVFGASTRADGHPSASSSTVAHTSTNAASPATLVSGQTITHPWKPTERFNQMVDRYNRSIHLSRDAEACFNRGREFSIRGAYRESLREYNRALKMAPRYVSAYAGRGLTRDLMGDKDGAAADDRMAIKLNPHYAPAYQNLATLKDTAGDLSGAIKDYTSCIQLEPECIEAFCNRAEALLDTGDKRGALKDCNQALELDGKCVLALCARADVLLDFDQRAAAADDYTRAIEIDPSCTRALTGRGNYRFTQLENESALDDYSRVVKLEPKSADAYYHRGLVWVRLNKIRKAKDDFNYCLQLDPRYSAAYIERGSLYGYHDKSSCLAAVNDYSRAIMLAPSDARARFGRAIARYFASDIPGAISDYTVLLGLKHSDIEALSAYEMRGSLYLQLKNYAAAIDDFNQYVKLDAKNPYCYALRASALYQSGNKVDAMKDWSKAVSLSPADSTTYNQAMKDITGIDVRKLVAKMHAQHN